MMAFHCIYRRLEDRFRGDPELISQRLQIYAPLLQAIAAQRPQAKATDLGCGRGEWLAVCARNGLVCTGVDQNPDMLAGCKDQDLPVVQDDILSYLVDLPAESQAMVSAFHVIEHLDFFSIQALIRESYRVLCPGGVLILETPNYANMHVATFSFHLDPTHQTPINPHLMELFMEHEGFSFSAHALLNGISESGRSSRVGVHDILHGAAYDLAIISIKGEQVISGDFVKKWQSQVSCMSTAALAEAHDILINQLIKRIERLESLCPPIIVFKSIKKILRRFWRK